MLGSPDFGGTSICQGGQSCRLLLTAGGEPQAVKPMLCQSAGSSAWAGSRVLAVHQRAESCSDGHFAAGRAQRPQWLELFRQKDTPQALNLFGVSSRELGYILCWN